MTTNKQIEETMEFNKKIIPILLSGFRYEDKYDEHFVAGQLKEEFDKLIKQTQKDTLDKVREIMKETWGGCACGYHGYLVLPDCDEEKHDKCFDCKLNQLEKKLVWNN